MRRRFGAGCIVAVALASLGVVGCGSDGDDNVGSSATTVPTTTAAPASSAPINDEERAERAALAAVGGGRVTSVDSDQQDDRPVWEVEVVASNGVEWDITVDQATGEIVEKDSDDDSDSDSDSDSDLRRRRI